MQEELFVNESILNGGTLVGLMGFGMMWMIFTLTIITVIVVSIIASWKIFTKAGKPGWASLIPFYNIYVLLQIANMPGWWLLAFFIPILSLVASIMLAVNLAHAFGKSTAYGVVLLWLLNSIGMLILAFGDAKYQGEAQVPVTKAIA